MKEYENGGRWWRWFEAIRSIYESGLAASMPASATAVLIELATHAKPDEWRVWPGLTAVGRRTGLSRQQAKAAVRLLVKAGVVEVEQVGCGSVPSTYKLNLPIGGRDDISTRLTYHPGLNITPGRDDVSPRGGMIYQPQTNTSNSYHKHTPDRACDSAAETIYQHYPRKVGKAAALKAINKALAEVGRREPDPLAWLLERVQAFAQSPAGQQGRFTPHASTWFNQARYDDDPAEWAIEDESSSNGSHNVAAKSAGEVYDAIKARRYTHAITADGRTIDLLPVTGWGESGLRHDGKMLLSTAEISGSKFR